MDFTTPPLAFDENSRTRELRSGEMDNSFGCTKFAAPVSTKHNNPQVKPVEFEPHRSAP